ncbi:hypothetical protein PybrP1_005163 [[Pythium] brassicae (nom. inval.)]|nr:hypothetical protein PybrP1_005163 [[Pythium] brassicae (nom. inval.)]
MPRATGAAAGDRSALFVQRNLELLGFADHASALVQTVKELFENALDATHLSAPSESWESAPPEMLRVHVRSNADSGLVDIVCTDTGVGLKAAVLYSQRHIEQACLRVVTTPSSTEILYVQLRIDPASEEPAVVKRLTQFVLDEDHRQFSGTEMRLSLPCPSSEAKLERAADTLATYFQTARYTLPAFLGVEFSFDVGGVSTRVDCAHAEEPIDRFTTDLGADIDDVAYVQSSKNGFLMNCMAVMTNSKQLARPGDIEICVLRFANHVPLINSEDILTCGIVKGVACKRTWTKLGLQCQPTSRRLVNQLVATPLRAPKGSRLDEAQHSRQLVIAIDVCSTSKSTLKYGCLKKSTLNACYSESARWCCQSALQQLVERGVLQTPQQCRDDDLLTNLAPLLANAVVNIASRSIASATANGFDGSSWRKHQRRGAATHQILEGDRIDVEESSEKQPEQEPARVIMSAIGALRQLEKEKNKDAGKGGIMALFTSLPSRIRQSGPVKSSLTFAKASWNKSSRWLWIFSTTMLITLVPLSLELLREEQTNEIVKELLGKGFTYGQIQNMGYSVTPPPSTLAADAQ